MTAIRQATIQRNTTETRVHLSLSLDGSGKSDLKTGLGFLDHMLDLFARHSLFDLAVHAEGDIHVDSHHTTEDVAICLGMAFREALGDKQGLHRYGSITLPMEETLVSVAVDLSGRSFFRCQAPIPSPKIGTFDSELIEDFWQSFSANALCNLHILLHYGRNSHHIAEAIFKATARALRQATARDPREPGIPSSKGVL